MEGSNASWLNLSLVIFVTVFRERQRQTQKQTLLLANDQ